MKSPTITALDIGTSAVCGITAHKGPGDKINVLAIAQSPCFGVRNGEVIQPLKVAEAVLLVKEKLAQKAETKIKSVFANISGAHLFSMPSQGLVSVSRADQKISQEDIERVLKAAQAVSLPSNKDVLDIFAKDFIIDGQNGIKEPLGLEGIRLEVRALLTCFFAPVLDNLQKAIYEAGLEASNILPSPLAAAEAVLSPEQKELGAAVIDIGAGTTSLAVFDRGDLIDFAVLPIGSANITNDIAICLRTEIKTAERIKKEFASLNKRVQLNKIKTRPAASDEKIEIPDKELSFPKKYLNKIVEARMADIISACQKELKRITSGEPLPAGLVLTGGGSKLPGIVNFAKGRFKLPVRKGTALIANIEEPEFSVCAGLLAYALSSQPKHKEKTSGNIGAKLKNIFKIFAP